jgi:hypothetical protein
MLRTIYILLFVAAFPLGAADPPAFSPVPLKKADEGPYVKLPAEIKAEINEFVVVKPDTNGTEVQYVLLDKGGLSLFPSEELKNPKNAVVIVKTAGRYRILAYTAAKDKASPPAIVTIVAGNAPPVPPGPEPGPGPQPPPAPLPGPRPAGFAGECYDKLKEYKASKDDLLIVQQALKRNLADPVNHPVILAKVLEIMRANGLSKDIWTPYIDWMRERMVAIYEADGTMATTTEVVGAMTAWQTAVEALLK